MSQGERKVGAVANSTSMEWRINDFSNLKNEKKLISPVFKTAYPSGFTSWELHLYPNGDDAESSTYLSLFINWKENRKITACVTLSLLDAENNKVYKCNLGNPPDRYLKFEPPEHLEYGYDAVEKKVLYHKRKQLLNEDTLKISCEVILVSESIDPTSKNLVDFKLEEYSCIPTHQLKVFDKLEQLFAFGWYSDITFISENTRIPVHKAIVASYSPVLAAMQERQDTIHISDIKYEVLKELLRFMYTGKVNGIDKIAVELLVAADKFSMPELKFVCTKTVSKLLTNNNVFHYLEMAIQHNSASFKSLLIDYIAKNREVIVHQPEFNQFGKLPPDVQCAIVRAVVPKSPQL